MTAEEPHDITADDTRQQEPGEQSNVANNQDGRQSHAQHEQGHQLSPTGPCWLITFHSGIWRGTVSTNDRATSAWPAGRGYGMSGDPQKEVRYHCCAMASLKTVVTASGAVFGTHRSGPHLIPIKCR